MFLAPFFWHLDGDKPILHILKFCHAQTRQEVIKHDQNWFIFRQQKIEFQPECLAWSCHYATGCFVAFLGDISTLKSGWNMKKLFCCPALELFHCLPLWKTVLFVSSRAFLLSTPTFLFSTPVEKSEATWKKATKCNKSIFGEMPKLFGHN